MDTEYQGSLVDEILSEISEEETSKQSSIRLKSALRTWNDYMKNKNIVREYTELSENYDFEILDDSTVLLSYVWDLVKENHPSNFINWFHKFYPSFSGPHWEVFTKELSILTGDNNTDTSPLWTLKERLDTMWPSLMSLSGFFILCVSVNAQEDLSKLSIPWPCLYLRGVLWTKFSEYMSVGVTKMLSLIRLGSRTILVHRDHLLNICDKMNERFNILSFSLLNDKRVSDLCVPSSVFSNIFSWGDQIVRKYKSRGFLILSNYEAFLVGLILRKGDKDLWDNHKFLNCVIRDVMEEIPDCRSTVEALLNFLSDMTPDQLCDIHGLYRVWGHPEVVLEEGLRKMHTNSTTEKRFDLNNLSLAHHSFKEIFCRNYYKIHNHYPVLKIDDACDRGRYSYLIRCLKSEEFINIDSADYVLSDWSLISLGRTFEVPYSWNLAHNIKDKAISPDRDELLTSIKSGRGVIVQDFRRTVLKWLKKNMMSMRDFLNMIDVNSLPDNSLIIGLYAKERELKWHPRFFSLMSFHLRLYFVATEQLLSDNLLRYFPQITMTVNLLDMTKKILDMSGKQRDGRGLNAEEMTSRYQRDLSYSINIDFKKWNQQMRITTTSDIFGSIDGLFGFNNLYKQTHSLLKRSFIYLCSGEHQPEISGSNVIMEYPWNWTHDESGKEGLRQKGWTIVTVSMIDVVMRRHNVVYSLIGGGDNQVLVVTLTTELVDRYGNITDEGKQESKARMEEIIKDLNFYFLSVGLPLKINETWVSSDLFAYNKIMCYRGKSLRSCSKTVSRTFPFSDDAAITISGMCSSISTSLKSLPSRDFSILPTYYYSRWISLWVSFIIYVAHPLISGGISSLDKLTIKYSLGGKGFIRDSDPRAEDFVSLLNSLLFHHRILGGSSLGCPAEWIMRGFPDPLTNALAWNLNILSKIGKHHPLSLFIQSTISCSRKAGEPNFLHLLSDPVSVNHDSIVSGVGALREVSEKAIIESSDITNLEFKELAQTCHSEASRDLVNSLCSASVIEPRFLHDIYGATLYGYFNSIVSRVDKSMTIMRLSKKTRVMDVILQREKDFISYLLLRNKEPYDLTPEKFECSRVYADVIRAFTWGKEISGVTVPSPVEYVGSFSEENHACDQNYILVSSVEHDIQQRSIGPFPPYLGSYTDEKFKLSPIAGAFGDENLLSKAIHIQKLRHWRYPPNHNVHQLIKDVLSSETDLNPDDLFTRMESSSSATHRYADSVLDHGAILNSNPDEYRWLYASTTTLSKRSKGGRNDMIHFQATLLWIMTRMVLRKISSGKCVPSSHVHEACPTCIVEVKCLSNDETEVRVPWRIPRMINNKVAYVRKENVSVNHARAKEMERFSHYRAHSLDPETIEMEGVLSDSISQALYMCSVGKLRLTDSNLVKMANSAEFEESLRKFKSLLLSHKELSQGREDLERLSGVLSSPCMRDIMKKYGVELDERQFLTSNREDSARQLSRLLQEMSPTVCQYLTSFQMSSTILIHSQILHKDRSLRNCLPCFLDLQKEIKFATGGKSVYGCDSHFKRDIPSLVVSIQDAYQLSKKYQVIMMSHQSESFPMLPNSQGYWNSVEHATETEWIWRVSGISPLAELLAMKETYGLLVAMQEVAERRGKGSSLRLITDGLWSHSILMIEIFRIYAIQGKIQTFLSTSSSSGSDSNSAIGFQEFLHEEDKSYVDTDPYDTSRISPGEGTLQIVTGETGTILLTEYIIFPLCSNRAVDRLKAALNFSRYRILYPRKNLDKSVWCLCIRDKVVSSSLFSVYMNRQFLKSRRLDTATRDALEDVVQRIRYPITLKYGLLDCIPELRSYVFPKSSLDMIINSQNLQRMLDRDQERKRQILRGRERFHAVLFICILGLTMGPSIGRIFVQNVDQIKYVSLTRELLLKRRRTNNLMVVSVYDLISEYYTGSRFQMQIFDKNSIWLGASMMKRGIHIYRN